MFEGGKREDFAFVVYRFLYWIHCLSLTDSHSMLSLNSQGEGICRAGKKNFPDKVNLSNICNHHEIVKRHFHFYISFSVMLKICTWPLLGVKWQMKNYFIKAWRFLVIRIKWYHQGLILVVLRGRIHFILNLGFY